MQAPWVRGILLALLPPLVVYGVVLARGYDGEPYLRGDCPYYYAAALSLIQDGDLDLANQLRAPLTYHTDYVSLDRRERIVPKHPLPLPLLSLPFVALLGQPGALAFNLLQLLMLLGVTWLLARRVAAEWAAGAAVALTGLASFLPHYAWNYSPDVLAALLLLGGVAALPWEESEEPRFARCALAGVLLGVACIAKLTFFLLLPALALLLGPLTWRERGALALGAAGPLLLFAALNLHLFGAPWTTAYDRIARVDPGQGTWIVHSQRGDLRAPTAASVQGLLLHPKQGMLPTSPITFIALAGFGVFWRRGRPLARFLIGVSVILLAFYACFPWDSSHHGNRFLIPIVCLAAAPLACLLEGLYARFGPPPGED